MQLHPHRHAVKVLSSGNSVDEALTLALEGLTDPQGHHARLAFHTFEVVGISGRFIDGAPVVEVMVEAFGAHKG